MQGIRLHAENALWFLMTCCSCYWRSQSQTNKEDWLLSHYTVLGDQDRRTKMCYPHTFTFKWMNIVFIMNSCNYKTACSISNELKSKKQIKAASSCDQNGSEHQREGTVIHGYIIWMCCYTHNYCCTNIEVTFLC